MSKFACIYFMQDNIIVSKDKLLIGRHPKITIESIWYKDVESYKVTIYTTFQEFTPKNWHSLEKQLLLRDVEYAYISGIVEGSHLFRDISVVNGQEIMPLTSYYILRYIDKYKLISKDMMSAKIGLVVGQMEETIDLIKSIMDDITDLTLYVSQPLIYKDIVIALHQKKKLRIRAVKPNESLLSRMDIIFDLSNKGIYAKWCSPKAIYIDYTNKMVRYMEQLQGLLPSIWYGFKIVWEGELVEIPVLQMLLGIQGLTGQSLRREFKYLDLSLAGVQTRRIS